MNDEELFMSSIVTTRVGAVEGCREGDLHVFRGIPFAAPPVGALRWRPPQPMTPWDDLRPATRFGAVAPQNPVLLDALKAMVIDGPQDEDCLYLNVWTPGLDAARRPVMVWIHGGGFTIGAGSQPIYDGKILAERGDLVVVSINYRLGPLGFLNLARISDGAIPATGNEGLLDQIAGLEWVRDNIEGFGGDPGNVTILGESAGGMSVGCLLGMPAARGLFHKAIPQSGASHTSNSAAHAERVAVKFLECVGKPVSDSDALLELSPTELLVASAKLAAIGFSDPENDLGTMLLQPVVDGVHLEDVPIEAIRKGGASEVAVMAGSTLDEWRLFGAFDPRLNALDEAGLHKRVSAFVGEPGPLIETYRSARQARRAAATPKDLYLAIETDRIFRMPGIRLLEAQRTQGVAAYSYLFDWPSPMVGGLMGSCHALELGFVFGTHGIEGMAGFCGEGPAADTLARVMQDAWIAFARTGDPSTAQHAFPLYDDARQTMVFGERNGAQSAPYEAERAAWDAVEEATLGTF